jgi:Leucine-rich repeat (LRR) protein
MSAVIRGALSTALVRPELLTDITSPYFLALMWMQTQDQYVRGIMDPVKLVQRYGVILLDVALPGGFTARNALLDECEWMGVTCSGTSANATTTGAPNGPVTFFNGTVAMTNTTTAAPNGTVVTGIKWAEQGRRGSIPPDLQVLSELVEFDLGDNYVNGTIPEALWTLTKLQQLYLHNNQLVGTLSEGVGNLLSLRKFFVGGNGLNGPLPKGLGSQGSGNNNVRPLGKVVARIHRAGLPNIFSLSLPIV